MLAPLREHTSLDRHPEARDGGGVGPAVPKVDLHVVGIDRLGVDPVGEKRPAQRRVRLGQRPVLPVSDDLDGDVGRALISRGPRDSAKARCGT